MDLGSISVPKTQRKFLIRVSGTQYQFLQWLGFIFCPQNFGIKYYQLRLPSFFAREFSVFTYHNFWGQLLSPPKSTPTYLKHDESVRGGVTLPTPPTHKNTTQKYLHNKKETTQSMLGGPPPPNVIFLNGPKIISECSNPLY
jgi:hypothetical protein